MSGGLENTVDQFLNAYWLRPETALWRSIDVMAMQAFQFQSPSMDFGCGDGLFSFIRSGGRLDRSFDVFQATTSLDHFFEGRDVYDAFDKRLSPKVIQKPAYQIDVAFDHKENLLKKAASLGLYKNCQLGDGNASLPFDTGTFASVFSNIVYWLNEPPKVLHELRRVTRPDGRILLMLPDSLLLEYSFYNSLHVRDGRPEWAWLDLIDRGRLSDNIKQAKSEDEWNALFAEAGLRVAHHGRHLSKPIVQIWDIGLRPLFPALMKMVQAVDPAKLPDVKEEWISTVKRFVKPLLDLEGGRDDRQAAFHSYVLTHQ